MILSNWFDIDWNLSYAEQEISDRYAEACHERSNSYLQKLRRAH